MKMSKIPSAVVNHRWLITRKPAVVNYRWIFLSFPCVIRNFWKSKKQASLALAMDSLPVVYDS